MFYVELEFHAKTIEIFWGFHYESRIDSTIATTFSPDAKSQKLN